MKFPARGLALVIWGILLLFVAKNSFAQTATKTPTPPPTYNAPNTEAGVPNNLHTYTQNTMIEVMSALTCQLVGIDATNPNGPCLGVNIKTGKIGYVQNTYGALGLLTQGIGMLYTPPIHADDYIHYLGQNFGFTKKTYAQGVGLTQLSPLIGIWSVFRNLTYLFAVIVFVLIGLGIMLRVKIDPRTVMGIQNQIPKIIIALIFITFSFAIAGFLIDLMYLSIYIIYGLLGHLPGVINLSPSDIQGKTVLNTADSLGIFSMAHNVALSGKDEINHFLLGDSHRNIPGLDDITGMMNSIFDINNWDTVNIVSVIYDFISLKAGISAAASAATTTPGFLSFLGGGTVVGLGIGAAVFTGLEFFLRNLLPYLIIFLIVIVALIITLFRVLFMLLRAYVGILLGVIFAPLWIAGGLIPGSTSVGMGPWIRDLAANLAVFPAVYAMFLLSQIIQTAIGDVGTGFAPPLIGNALVPGFLGAVTSLGLILMTPEVIKMTKAAFKAPKLQLGVGLGAATGIVTTPIRKIGAGMFGKNPYTGKEKVGSLLLKNKYGQIGSTLTGGGFGESSNKTEVPDSIYKSRAGKFFRRSALRTKTNRKGEVINPEVASAKRTGKIMFKRGRNWKPEPFQDPVYTDPTKTEEENKADLAYFRRRGIMKRGIPPTPQSQGAPTTPSGITTTSSGVVIPSIPTTPPGSGSGGTGTTGTGGSTTP